MSPIKRLFTRKALVRSLQIFAGIAIVYFGIALALIYWPSPEPFGGQPVANTGPVTMDAEADADVAIVEDVEEVLIEAADGTKLFARRYVADSSTTIILMHGIAADSAKFEYAARLLRESTGAEVITPDFRGHGKSGGARFDVAYIGHYENDLEFIVRFINENRPGHRIIVAGHSMGGGVAMRYALKDDAPVPDAYLLFAPNFGEGPTQRSGDDSQDTSAFVHFDLKRMIGIIMLNSVAINALDELPILYFNTGSERKDYSYRAVMSAQPIRPDTSDLALQAVASPLLVIVGAEDEVFEVSQFEPFVSANSDGETAIVPGLNHDGVVSDPATYKIVAEWYNRLP